MQILCSGSRRRVPLGAKIDSGEKSCCADCGRLLGLLGTRLRSSQPLWRTFPQHLPVESDRSIRERGYGFRPLDAAHPGTTDELPEQVTYRDEGCELAPHCLSCPLPLCRYDLAHKQAGAIIRANQLRPLLAQGLTKLECAAALGVTPRTVARIKAAIRDGTLDHLGLPTVASVS